MPEALTEITLVVRSNREPSSDERLQMGRDAAAGLMNRFGTRAYGYRNGDHRLVESISFNRFTFPSTPYPLEDNDSQWAVTEHEISNWGEDDDYDEDDDY